MSPTPTSTKACPQCGRPVPADASYGLCPACVVTIAVGAEAHPELEEALPRPQISDYALLEEIGRGATGVVWKAKQLSVGRLVALKVLRTGAFSSESAKEHLTREARAIGALRHPNIVRIYEVGDENGAPFLSMEFIAGQPLSARIRESPPTAYQVAVWFKKLASALSHAHQCAIVHRDLNPGNILIDKDDEPLLTDFGLAKLLDAEVSLTIPGQVVGAASFMAPEQAENKKSVVGPLSDIYSLGAVLYYSLAGRAPFVSDSIPGTLRQVIEAEPLPIRAFSPAVPADLETICLKCIEKLPSRRYQSSSELEEDLDRFLNDEPIKARPISPLERSWRACRRRPSLSIAGCFSLLCLCITLVSLVSSNRQSRVALTKIKKAEESATQLAAQNHAALVRQLAARGCTEVEQGDLLSSLPWLVAAWEKEKDTSSLPSHAMRFGAVASRIPILHQAWFQNESLLDFDLTDDGRTLALASADGKIALLDLLSGGTVSELPKADGQASKLRFSPTGSALAVAMGRGDRPTALRLIDLPSGTSSVVTNLPGDVRQFAFASRKPLLAVATRSGAIRFINYKTGAQARSDLTLKGSVERVLFCKNDSRLIAAGWTDRFLVWNLEKEAPLLSVPQKEWLRDIALSPDEDLLATTGDEEVARLWAMESGEQFGSSLSLKGRGTSISFSADGSKLATGDDSGTVLLWEVTTGRLLRSFQVGTSVREVRFNSDGSLLLVRSLSAGATVLDVNGGKPDIRLVQSAGVSRVSWVPHELRKLVVTSRDGVARYYELKAKESDILRCDERVSALAISPNAEWLLAVAGIDEAWLWHMKDTPPSKRSFHLPGTFHTVGFSADARRFFGLTDDGFAAVWDTKSGNRLTPELRASASGSDAIALSPDGSLLLWGTRQGETHAFDVELGHDRFDLLRGTNEVTVVRFTVDGRRFLTGTGARDFIGRQSFGEVRVWDSHSGLSTASPMVHASRVTSASFSTDGSKIVSAQNDGLTLVWDAHSGKRVLPPFGHRDAVLSASFSPDSHSILTGSNDGRARLWDATTGNLASSAFEHPGDLKVAFDPQGKWILTVGSDQSARVWDAETGLPLFPPLTHSSRVRSASWSPDGRFIATGGNDRLIKLWPVPSPPSLAEARAMALLLSSRSVDQSGNLTPASLGTLRASWEIYKTSVTRLH